MVFNSKFVFLEMYPTDSQLKKNIEEQLQELNKYKMKTPLIYSIK